VNNGPAGERLTRYGVMACLVAERTREIGVRMALGASASSAVNMMIRQAGAVTMMGVAAGRVGARAFSRFLTTLVFGVSATDPIV
jgi:putative ABC transport system permease protein